MNEPDRSSKIINATQTNSQSPPYNTVVHEALWFEMTMAVIERDLSNRINNCSLFDLDKRKQVSESLFFL